MIFCVNYIFNIAMLNILFFKQTISHLKQKFYKFKSTLSTQGLHVLCVLSFWVAPIRKYMACKVTYLLNAYDIFTSFILNINQTCKINFAYRL